MVIKSGGVDLPVGPVTALSAVLSGDAGGGVPVPLAIAGVPVAVAAGVLLGRLAAAEPTLGTLWGLDPIAAAAIGGACLIGGRGSILGSLRNGLTLVNDQAFYLLLATGIIIIVAMLIDKATRGKQGG